MKVSLSITARLKVSELLSSQKGSRAKLKLLREAAEELSLSEEEILLVSYREEVLPSGNVKSYWDASKDPNKECEIGSTVLEAIIKALKGLDEAENLTQELDALYDKFLVAEAVK